MGAKGTDEGGGADEGPVPSILRPWVAAYRACPKLRIPGTTVDVAFSLVAALLFALVRISARRLLAFLGWPSATFLRAECDGDAGCEATLFAAACLTSLVHCSTVLPGLGSCLYHTKAFGGYVPSAKMDSAPRWWRDAAAATVAFTTGYMIYDSVVGYAVETWVGAADAEGGGWFGRGRPVLNDEDLMYLVHHVLCTLCMLSARIQGSGHLAAMILMFTGEFTAPVMNAQLILQRALSIGAGGEGAERIAAVVDQVYSLLYVLFRTPVVGIGYVCAAHLTYDLLFTKRGRKNASIWVSLAWMPMIWGVLIGSIPTLYGCFNILRDGPLGSLIGGGEDGGGEL